MAKLHEAHRLEQVLAYVGVHLSVVKEEQGEDGAGEPIRVEAVDVSQALLEVLLAELAFGLVRPEGIILWVD